MAIRRMTRAEDAGLPNVETVTNYPGHEINRVSHCSGCAHRDSQEHVFAKAETCCVKGGKGCGNQYCWGCKTFDPLYMLTTHVGVVLDLGEYNGRDDSDFYAIVWNDELGRTERIEYASTRGWTYPNNAWVDATPEVVAKYQAWCEKMRQEHLAREAEKEAKTPRHGKRVKVVKGRKVPIGTEGEVFWTGKCQFSGGLRIGLRTTKGDKFFTDGKNVEVIL